VPTPIASARDVGVALKEVWARPGTRLGFYGHMATQFPMMVFALLWGLPYLVSAQHLSESTASLLIMAFGLSSVVIGPVIGVLTGRHPLHRSWLILGVVAADIAIWTLILALPGPAPLWLLVALVVILAAGGPGSVVGLDIARTANPRLNLGVAQSIANLGGFLATLFVLAVMGAVMTAAGRFTPEAFGWPRLSRIRCGRWPSWALSSPGARLAGSTPKSVSCPVRCGRCWPKRRTGNCRRAGPCRDTCQVKTYVPGPGPSTGCVAEPIGGGLVIAPACSADHFAQSTHHDWGVRCAAEIQSSASAGFSSAD
jgi:MFS family permease